MVNQLLSNLSSVPKREIPILLCLVLLYVGISTYDLQCVKLTNGHNSVEQFLHLHPIDQRSVTI